MVLGGLCCIVSCLMLVLNAGSLLVSTGLRKYVYFMLSFAVCSSFFCVFQCLFWFKEVDYCV